MLGVISGCDREEGQVIPGIDGAREERKFFKENLSEFMNKAVTKRLSPQVDVACGAGSYGSTKPALPISAGKASYYPPVFLLS